MIPRFRCSDMMPVLLALPPAAVDRMMEKRERKRKKKGFIIILRWDGMGRDGMEVFNDAQTKRFCVAIHGRALLTYI